MREKNPQFEQLIDVVKANPVLEQKFYQSCQHHNLEQDYEDLGAWVCFLSRLFERQRLYRRPTIWFRAYRRFLYQISLVYNQVFHFFWHYNQPTWWSQITENIILGAIPLRSHLAKLKEQKVSVVLSMVEPFEKMPSLVAHPIESEDWASAGVYNVNLSCVDFGPISLLTLYRGVEELHKASGLKKLCYVHCKAGKGRSAAAVLAYLATYGQKSIQSSFELLFEKRPIISIENKKPEILIWYHLFHSYWYTGLRASHIKELKSFLLDYQEK